MSELDPSQDPARDLLTLMDYGKQADRPSVRTPISLEQAAADFGAMVEAGRTAEGRLERDYPGDDTVGLSGNRGKVIISLLEELAIRLEPGRAVGPIQGNAALSDLALEISRYLRAGY